ncbi:hypothetical protein GCM10027413_01310 [Conyzicola nivalis]|uniref:Uncharacterized protein n=1 Tax=Conyzicola nivalis TaxID=1477021 RepID=A0A916SP00_9MICO|nr:hypothetical protein [Conyzicola nivalis]GGB09653.1 hypothetical protein GCM10010979_25330 [Conyzicola nivalis]
MLDVFAIALVIVGTALGFISARQITRANTKAKIPWAGRIPNQPKTAPLWRGVGGALAIWGSLSLYSTLGAFVILLVFATTASPLLVFVAHNRRVAAAG